MTLITVCFQVEIYPLNVNAVGACSLADRMRTTQAGWLAGLRLGLLSAGSYEPDQPQSDLIQILMGPVSILNGSYTRPSDSLS